MYRPALQLCSRAEAAQPTTLFLTFSQTPATESGGLIKISFKNIHSSLSGAAAPWGGRDDDKRTLRQKKLPWIIQLSIVCPPFISQSSLSLAHAKKLQTSSLKLPGDVCVCVFVSILTFVWRPCLSAVSQCSCTLSPPPAQTFNSLIIRQANYSCCQPAAEDCGKRRLPQRLLYCSDGKRPRVLLRMEDERRRCWFDSHSSYQSHIWLIKA